MCRVLRLYLLLIGLGVILVTLAVAGPRGEGRSPWLLYMRDSASSGPTELYRIHPDGSGSRLLLARFIDVWSPRWSPDGKWIAFLARWDVIMGGDDRTALYRMRADGRDVQMIARFDQTSPPVDGALVWSEDGARIVVGLSVTGHTQVYQVRADGSYLSQWQNDSWSSAGGTVVHGGDEWLRATVTDPLVTVSPGGRWVTRVHTGYMDETMSVLQVWPLGSSPQEKTPPTAEIEVPGRIDSLTWSPDGEQIVYSVRQNGLVDLYRLRLASGGVVDPLVLGDSFSAAVVAWSPDGRFIALQANRPHQDDYVFLLPADSARLRTLDDLPQLASSSASNRFSLSRPVDWAPPLDRSTGWGWLLLAGLACMAAGIGVWARALIGRRLPLCLGALPGACSGNL